MIIKSQKYTIGDIRIQVNFLCPQYSFNTIGGSAKFQVLSKETDFDWTINLHHSTKNLSVDYKTLFTGVDKFADLLPFKWSIIKKGNQTGFLFEQQADNSTSGYALINDIKQVIDITLVSESLEPFSLDPFFHPIGILTLQHLAHIQHGFVIHASAVAHNNKGYLFSAVSGTGKSTMAGLWQKCGAKIINDDRLMIIPSDEGYLIHNTPMPYYQDIPKSIKLHKAFLLKQSPTNYIKSLSSLQGTVGLLSNCIQHLYDEQQVKQRLNTLERISQVNGVYEVGFKPDTDIVELILEQFG